MNARLAQFDSHRFVKRLTSAGLSEEVAEILAEEHSSLVLPADVATKTDLADTEERIRASTREDIAAAEERIRASTREDIAAAEERIRAFVREDIAAAEMRGQARLAAAVADFKDALAEYKTSTLKWVFGMMMAFSGIVITTVITAIVSIK